MSFSFQKVRKMEKCGATFLSVKNQVCKQLSFFQDSGFVHCRLGPFLSRENPNLSGEGMLLGTSTYVCRIR